MRSVFLLVSALLVSTTVNAGDFYSVKSLWSGHSQFYSAGDIVYCTGLEAERNIGLGCVNLNIMESHTVKSDAAGNVVLTVLEDGDSVVVGYVDESAGQFILDGSAAGYMSKVSLKNAKAKIEANILVRKKLAFNDDIGCQGVWDCDWTVIYSAKKVSLEVKLNNKRLEKVPLN